MKRFFVFLGVVLWATGSAASAQEVESNAPMQKSSWGDAKTDEVASYIPEISLDMRGGYRLGSGFGSGRFTGDDLNINIDGYISPCFSYSFNHRIASSYYGEASGFDATNWLTLTYEVGDFSFTAGKDALMMGSFEYDAYDIDAYFEMNSAFYNMFDCWQWGISAAWYPAESHEILLQAANSPFSYGKPELFSYAAGWRGYWDCYESYWTVNLWQYATSGYVKSINLGNRFHFGNCTIDLDYMTRAVEVSDLFLSDFTLTLSPAYCFGEWGRIFAKAGLDRMGHESFYEDSGDNFFYGGGFEYFPLKENKSIRLHVAYTHNDYTIGDLFSIGLTWKMNLTKSIRTLLGAKED